MRAVARICLGLIVIVMWFPARNVFGVDLASLAIQGTLFALGMLCCGWVTFRRLPSSPYFQYGSNLRPLGPRRVFHNILATVLALIALAGILEMGQRLLSARHAAAEDFLSNGAAIIGAGCLCYLAAALILRTARGRRLPPDPVTLD